MAVVATMVKRDDILVSARRPGPSFDKFGLGKASNLFFSAVLQVLLVRL